MRAVLAIALIAMAAPAWAGECVSTTTTYRVTASDFVAVKAAPRMDAKRIGKLMPGDTVTIEECFSSSGRGWSKVHGRDGWIFVQPAYLELIAG